MRHLYCLPLLFANLFATLTATAQSEKLIYHDIKVDESGKIIPWYSKDNGKAYNNAIMSVWHFWDTMRLDMNGLPYYMNHQVWHPGVNDIRGIGGDQISMALSSWRLLYAYSGDEKIKENMKFMIEYYLTHGFSAANAAWPGIPYPYNTLVYSGIYDGDMVIGKNFTQPDKAGSFGHELMNFYQMTGYRSHGATPMNIYLDAAIKIANTLAKQTVAGDHNQSPLPFKVNAITGEIGKLQDNNGSRKNIQLSNYTSNWSGTMELFLTLIKVKKGNTVLYQKAFDTILAWMKKYPLLNNRWGPFFEDVPGWSDTQINAVTFAQFMMNHTGYFPNWKKEVKNIFAWVYATLGNKTWEKYGATVINEQTAYLVPGNSHSGRQASAELQYAALTGDTSYKENAIRVLNWATYMVNDDGRNRYPSDDNWLTDGYGDYVRHYLRSFAAMPLLAPADEDHLLSSTSIVQYAEYKNSPYKDPRNDDRPAETVKLFYGIYDKSGKELLRLTAKPAKVLFNKKPAVENKDSNAEGYFWQPLEKGGLLTINRTTTNEVELIE